jgi:hypothetical protein
MANAGAGAVREVSIGRVFSRGFGAIGAHPVATFGLGFVGALPGLILSVGFAKLLPQMSVARLLAMAFGVASLSMAFTAIVEGALVFTILAHSEGRRADIVDTLPPAMSRLVPLMLLGLLIGAGYMLGLFVLIIPGVMLYVIWWVAAPAFVVERLGVIAALGRSVELTSGARWHVFGVQLVLGIASWVVGLMLRGAGIASAGGLATGGALSPNGGSLIGLALFAGMQAIGLTIYAAMHASMYLELREWKEGPATDALAEIFG